MKLVAEKKKIGRSEVYCISAMHTRYLGDIVSYGETEELAWDSYRTKILGYRREIESILVNIFDTKIGGL